MVSSFFTIARHMCKVTKLTVCGACRDACGSHGLILYQLIEIGMGMVM
jgi:hypothetical protein